MTTNQLPLYIMSREKFYRIAFVFQYIRHRIYSVGSLWMEVYLSPDEAADINRTFPNAVRTA